MRAGLPRAAACAVILALSVPVGAPPASACQRHPVPPVATTPPPTWMPPIDEPLDCELVADEPFVRGADPIGLRLVVRNTPSAEPFPPPWANDRVFEFAVRGPHQVDTDGDTVPDSTGMSMPCPTPWGGATFSPNRGWFLLDDGWAPLADDPSTTEIAFTLDPRGLPDPATTFGVSVQVRSQLPDGRIRGCSEELCIPTLEPGEDPPTPTAVLVDPLQGGAGGDVVRYDLRLERNGYPLDRPLTVRVLPGNELDPLDIFPLDPPGLATTGVTFVGEEEESVSFDCHLHFPCFVGASNTYRVSIHDGATLLWESGVLGRATVERAPLVGAQVTPLDAGCDGRLSACEPGRLSLRLMARNPIVGAPVHEVMAELAIPDELSIVSWETHYKDNPLDEVDPTPEELAAPASVTTPPGMIRVEIPRLDTRGAPDGPAPVVFRDLLVVDVVLETPPDGIGRAGDLVFGSAHFTGRCGAIELEEWSSVVSHEVLPGAPPDAEVSPPGATEPLRVLADGETLAWQSCASTPADGFNLYRADLRGRESARFLCISAGLETSTFVDSDPLPPWAPSHPWSAWAYLVAPVNCAGEGPLGPAASGRESLELTSCP